ncbi:MAG TPA: hypothetical protein VGD58_21615, partial [Herpetosiphonaceae bacterium]
RQRLGQSDFALTLSTWMLLDELIERRMSWAEDVARSHWPTNTDQQMSILEVTNEFDRMIWLQNCLVELIPQLDSERVRSHDWLDMIQSRKDQTYPDWLIAACSFDEDQALQDFLRIAIFSIPLGPYGMEMEIPELFEPYEDALTQFPLDNPSWAPYIAAARFAEQPGAEVLARELRWLSTVCSPDTWATGSYGSWPLAACIAASHSRDDLRKFADRAEQGLLGQAEDWYAAQQRWLAQGVTEDDILYLTDERWPYDAQICDVGFPLSCSGYGFHRGGDMQLWQSLWNLYEQLPVGKARSIVANALLDLLSTPRGHRLLISIELDQFKQLLLDRLHERFRFESLRGIRLPEILTDDWIEFFDWLGYQKYTATTVRWPWLHTAQLAETYTSYPDRHGLLHVLEVFAVFGNTVSVPKALLSENCFIAESERLAGALISIAQGDWNDAEVTTLARLLVNAPASEGMIEGAIAAMNNGNLPHADKERLLLALRDRLMIQRKSELKSIVEALHSLMQSRRSTIGEPETWAVLGLPLLP